MFRYFKKAQISHCITHQPFIGLLALPVCWMLSIPFMVYIQNIEYQRFKSIGKWWWPILKWIEKWIYRKADHLFFISPDDLRDGMEKFSLKNENCSLVSFGTSYTEVKKGRQSARNTIIQRHQLDPQSFLLLFFGPQSYAPNLEAVELILKQITPLLLEKANDNYKLLICGGGLPSHYQKLESFKAKNIEYLGFVEDIEEYVQAVDLIINPILSGGGVKTKVIEAIALGKTVVSFAAGAKGMDIPACGKKLIVVADEDYQRFCNAIINIQKGEATPTPPSFFETYYWANTIKPVLKVLNRENPKNTSTTEKG